MLKQPWAPVPAEKYPRLTALVLAALCSGYAVWQSQAGSLPPSFIEWIAITALSVGTAALAYNAILKNEHA